MDMLFLTGVNSSYLLLVGVTLIIGLGASAHVHRQINRYSHVPSSLHMSGASMVQTMLAANGVHGLAVHRGGPEQNHFDPRTNDITLDPQAYGTSSVTAIATACHEAGHALQFAEGYAPMKIRGAIVPVVNLASNLWIFLLLIGIFMNIAQLTTLAIVLYACVVVFQLVTLPVEFDASRRAMAYLSTTGISAQERDGAAKVLRACALTYVAAALTSILQLLWLLGQNRDE